MRIPMAILCLGALGSAHGAEPRALSFVHTHSGEQVACTFKGGEDDAGCLAKFQHLLRDWRDEASHDMDPALFDILYELRVATGRDATYEIISAYRSPVTNKMLRSTSAGVAEKSQHLQGKAIDVRLRGFPTEKLAALARSLKRGGVGYYAESDFVHVDTGRVRAW